MLKHPEPNSGSLPLPVAIGDAQPERRIAQCARCRGRCVLVRLHSILLLVFTILLGQHMAAKTFEGTIENGQVRLRDGIVLPEKTKVYVLVPDVQSNDVPRLRSPRLAHPRQIGDFRKQVIDTETDATV